MALLSRGLSKLAKLAAITVCFTALMLGTLSSVWVPNAYAVGSERAGEIMNERAARELDRVAGEGTSDQLEGAVDGAIGSVKRSVSEVGDLDVDQAARKLDGATDELKGKVKRDIGRAKAATSEVGDDIEDASEGIVESIKEFFD